MIKKHGRTFASMAEVRRFECGAPQRNIREAEAELTLLGEEIHSVERKLRMLNGAANAYRRLIAILAEQAAHVDA